MAEQNKQEVKQFYTKRPIPVAAKQWLENGDHPEVTTPPPFCTAESDIRCEKCGNASGIHGFIKTLEGGNNGAQLVCPGDWIITGVRGEHYPCKPDIFAETYQVAKKPGPVSPEWIAAKALLEKMDAIESSPEYRSIWETAFIHGNKYTGAKWDVERENLRAAIERNSK